MRRVSQLIGVSRRGFVSALCLLALLAGLLASPAPAAETGRRVALVIGNSGYVSLPKLRNPANDANLVAESLAKLGFEVVSMSDASFENLKAVVARFGEMSRGADVALFYFAGHGVQVGGTNYLLPIDASVKSAADLGSQGLDIGLVIEEIKKAAPHASVVILDACRDNPLPAGVAGSGGIDGAPLTSGLARVQGMSGLLIAYATAPGQVAYDGFGANSPFAAALAHYLDEPGLEVGLLFRRVRQRVIESTAGAQIPWVEEALLEPLYVHPEGPAVAQATDIERLNGALEIEQPEMRLAALVDLAATPKDPSILPVVASHIERLREPEAPVPETASKRLVQELVDWHLLRMIQSRPAARLAATAFLQLHPDGIFADRAHGFVEGEAASAEAAAVSEADAELVWLLVSRREQKELFDRFVELVPSGRFSDLARARRKIQMAALPVTDPNSRTATSPTGEGSGQPDTAGAAASPANRSMLPVFVGTGPTQIALPMTPALLAIAAPPKYGTLVAEQADGTVSELRAATQGPPVAVRKLSYRPDPETRDAVDEFVIAATAPTDRGLVVGDAANPAPPLTVRADIKPHQCDLLAGARFDTQGVVTGIYSNEIDPEPAIAACREAIAAFPGVARFRYQLGRALAVAGRSEEAAKVYREAADAGHYAALYELGTLYERGTGVTKDLNEAIRLFNEAAAHGDLYAATRLGVLYRDGKGVPKDTAKAIEWLVKAARGGHTFAFNHLGYMYLEGNGVQPDYERAFRLFEASANAGDIYGYNNMGLMYERGKFVAADPAKAIAWYEKAARGGQPQAPINLGLMYQGDRGIPADLRRAAYWFAEGARLGNAWGFTNLGWLYQSGRGIDSDPGLASELYAQALRMDPDDAGATAIKNFAKLPPKAPVRAIQKRLAALGFDVGTADGSWNKQTREAVSAFAKAQGLTLDANAPKIRILAALIEAADQPKPTMPAAN